MQPIQTTEKINYIIPEKKKDTLENLFKMAEKGRWDWLNGALSVDSSLLNATFADGPNEGKTILWIAAYRFVKENNWDAYRFIIENYKLGYELNLDACPASHKGESVFWLMHLAFHGLKKNYFLIYKKELPKEFVEYFYNEQNILLRLPSIPYLEMTFKDYGGKSDTYTTLQWLLENLNILKEHNSVDLLIKMLEDYPNCNVNTFGRCGSPYSPLDCVICKGDISEHKKLILYLILCGAKLPSCIPESYSTLLIEGYTKVKSMIQDLQQVFKKALTSYLSIQSVYKDVPTEIKLNIAFTMIWSSFPELEKVPQKVMQRWLRSFPLNDEQATGWGCQIL